jgi:hypothetical protein
LNPSKPDDFLFSNFGNTEMVFTADEFWGDSIDLILLPGALYNGDSFGQFGLPYGIPSGYLP